MDDITLTFKFQQETVIPLEAEILAQMRLLLI